MNEQLKAQLRACGLYPLEIDPEMQEYWRRRGVEPSELEFHYNPGTSRRDRERMERIRDNCIRLHKLDEQGRTDSTDYRETEEEIRTDFHELHFPTVEDVLEKMAQEPPRTGTIGVYRDIPPENNTEG